MSTLFSYMLFHTLLPIAVSSLLRNLWVYCKGPRKHPSLLISARDYRNLCGNVGYPVTYKYFSTHPIGEHRSDIRCSTGTPYSCTYTEHRNPYLSN
ncbi:hypothetical protein Zmor_019211 [Zophobas morio]|uniref:Secreted protein n=1 Tax=Zophobas morio TaxID=2755281 RepID=A0AA38I1I1_9CUCU|nr:hypothetical protein Zmor_019211 [Zophobas morio]